MSDYLPADLIAGILLRLPVDALLRCRCVSKACGGLIDSPKFSKLQIEHSTVAAKNAILLISEGDSNFIFAEYVDGLRYLTKAPRQFSDPDPRKDLTLLGSCNGLLCFGSGHKKVLVMNPATRKGYDVPIILSGESWNVVAFSSDSGHWAVYHTGYGFGYDSVSDDYKVVEIVQTFKPKLKFLESELLSYGVWSKCHGAVKFPYVLAGLHNIGVFVGGAIHWMVNRHDDSESGIVIVGFDLGLNECREVPQPEYPNGKSFRMKIGELGKCLCIFANYNERCVDVWMMKEYGVKESWNVLFSVPHPGLCYNRNEIRPLGFSMTGQEVLLQLDRKRLVWYDLKDPQKAAAVGEITIRGLKRDYMDAVVCFGSLVPPDGKFPPPPKEEVKVDKPRQKEQKTKRGDFLSTGFKLKL